MNFNKDVTNYIAKANTEQIDPLEKLRQLIHKTVSNVSEEIKWGFPVFAKTKDFAYLRFAKKHITLGFYNIDKIEDPDDILEGSGNTLKHIKIKNNPDFDFDEKLISKWLKAIAI